MTGVAVVTSPHACDQLRDIFIKEYLDESSFSVKTAWQTLAMCKAAIEITSGDKRSTNKIHSDMIVKYQRWSNLICSDAETVLNLHNPPEYLQPALFMTSDTKGTKEYPVDTTTGKKFWRKWGTVKRSILGVENVIIKKTIAKMPGGALPSGTDMKLFMDRVIYGLYMYKMKEKNQAIDEHLVFDHDDEKDVGGSPAKAAGTSPHMIISNSDGENNCAEDNDDSASGQGILEKAGDKVDDDNATKGNNATGEQDNHQSVEPKAPSNFFPANLLVVLMIGVLSNDSEQVLDHVGDETGENCIRKAEVPTRAQCREDSFSELSEQSLLPKNKRGLDDPIKFSVTRLKERADYNQVYKKVNEAKVELSEKRLKMDEKSLNLREMEVNSRKKEVESAHLNLLYNDLRKDLKDAKEDNNVNEIARIKDEMHLVRTRRISLIDTNSNK